MKETVDHKFQMADKVKNTKTLDPKAWWHTAFMGKVTNSVAPPMRVDQKEYFDQKSWIKSRSFQPSFSSFLKLDTQKAQLPPFSFKTAGRLSEINIEEENVKAILKELNISKAIGSDSISTNILKETADTTELINLSLSKGKVPLLWKQLMKYPSPRNKTNQHLAGIGQYHYCI